MHTADISFKSRHGIFSIISQGAPGMPGCYVYLLEETGPIGAML